MAISKIISESLDLTDNYAFTGTVTGAGGVNTPMVLARASTATTYPTDTNVKTTLDNEIIDTDNLFSSSRFTVTSGYEGKYLVNWRLSFNFTSTAELVQSLIYKNGSNHVYGQHYSGRSQNHTMMSEVTYIIDMTTNDYLEFYGRQSDASRNNNGGDLTHVWISKLIT